MSYSFKDLSKAFGVVHQAKAFLSTIEKITNGVPQGAVLGPVHFAQLMGFHPWKFQFYSGHITTHLYWPC